MWLSSAALVWSEPDRDVKVSDMSIFLTSIKPISSLAMISSDDLLLLLFAVAQLVEALRYKSEGHGFDSRWCHWNFSLT